MIREVAPYLLEGLSDPEMYFPKQSPNGEFHPKKHTVQSYRSRQRAAKKRRNIK